MKNNKAKLLAAAVAMGISAQASAAITLYDNEGTTFSTDGYFNTFYVTSSIDTPAGDRDQSRVRMGFLPNYIGFNFSKKIDDLTIGGRSSFWVTINDSDPTRAASQGRGESLGTESGIDVRQFYATVDGSFGQILVGKDFGLFGRAIILGDELLIGYGQTSDTLGLIDGGNVSFGNIGTGYSYPFPKAQITYRTPATNGFQLAVGIMDPNKSSGNVDLDDDGIVDITASEESAPRFEAEATFGGEMFSANISALYQSSDATTVGQEDVDSTGIAGGVKFKAGGFALGLSGTKTEGTGLFGLDTLIVSEDIEVTSYLAQASYTAGATRFVVSYGNTETEDTSVADSEWEYENTAVGVFHSVNSNLILIAEYNKTEVELTDEEVDTVALGAVVLF